MERPLKSSGFSLAETVLAIGLLALVCVSLVLLFASGLRALGKSQNKIQAALLAQDVLEKILHEKFGYQSDSCDFDGRLPTPVETGFPPPPYPGLSSEEGSYQISVKTWPADNRLKVVRVTVYSPQQGPVQLESLMAR